MSRQIFIQPERSHSLWHAEPGDNYFIAVEGAKKWRLVPPYYSAGMYPVIKNSSVYHVSKVDGRESNDIIAQRGFPLYRYVPKYSATVERGDILILPNYWWHTVTNVPGSHTISLTFRTLSELNLAAPIFWFLKKTDPKSIEIRKKVLKYGRLYDEDVAASLYAFADPKNDLVKRRKNEKIV
jgi:ribosomal protein L16 Arg81 hydroxylase